MKIQNEIILAIDTASTSGLVTAFNREQILAEQALKQKMSHATLLCGAIENVEKNLISQGLKISCVAVGLGPGSFVGLRIAMATALGFSFGRKLPLMGFCSHRALASSIQSLNKNYTIAMKASGDWCYVTRYENISNNLIETSAPEELLKDNIFSSTSADSLIITDLSFAKENQFSFTPILGPNAIGIKEAFWNRISFLGEIQDESDKLRPNYVRAPSVTIKSQNAQV